MHQLIIAPLTALLVAAGAGIDQRVNMTSIRVRPMVRKEAAIVTFNATRTSLRALVGLGTFLVLGVLVLLMPQRAYAAAIHVNGTTCTLPEAIAAANLNVGGDCTAGSDPSDTIYITGTHSLSVNFPNADGATATPSITSTIIISGGVSGAIVERIGSENMRLFHVAANGDLTIANVTVRNGAINGSGFSGSGGAIFNRKLLTLVDSRVTGNTAQNSGGGIYNLFGGNATLTNSQVTSNTATTGSGGGIYNSGGNATLTNSQVTSNTATSDGGGIVISGGNATLTNSQITSNTAQNSGGGIDNNGGTATLNGSQVTGNRATVNGGGIFNRNSSNATLTNSQVTSNTANWYGGGIYNTEVSTATLTNSQVTGNSATSAGGGIYNQDGNATLTNSPVSTNTAQTGGGIYNQDGTATLTNSPVSANTAQFGGGIFNGNSTITLTDSPVSANTATVWGGGIYNEYSGTATLNSSQVTGNTATEFGGGIYNIAGTATLTNSQVTGNTAQFGGGIYNIFGGTATLTNSQVTGNTATTFGGGIYNIELSDATLTNSQVTSNTAQFGGGIYNTSGGIDNNGSTATLINSQVSANTATSNGGGIYNTSGSTITLTSSQLSANTAQFGGGILSVSSTATLTNTQVTTNTAQFGGGIYNDSSTTTLTNSQVSANTVTGSGGGIYNYISSTATLTNSQVTGNTAQLGGGIFNADSGNATLTNSQVSANTATGSGGGIYNYISSTATLTNTQVTSNTAQFGGGIYNVNLSTATLNGSQVTGNTASTYGGGIFNTSSTATLTNSQVSANSAAQGGAVYQELGLTTIDQSCIVNNTDTAVYFAGGTQIVATNNWWGAPDGPSGVGPGAGDSVSSGVTFAPFSAVPLLGCPQRSAQVGFSKSASPSGTLLPGQPLTFTLTISNESELSVKKLHVADTLPADFIVSQVITTGPVISVSGSTFVITQLLPSQVATIAFVGQVDPTLTSDTTLTNTATLTSSIIDTLPASAVVNVALPLLNWSSTTYAAPEASGSVAVTITLTPPQPYATVTVEAIDTDSAEIAAITAVQVVTFPPGSSSQQVIMPVVDDEGVSPRTILLQLQSPSGAKLGNVSSATILIDEDDQAGLAVQKSVTPSEASVGESITYTYRITNTGTVTLKIAAHDNRLGAVTGLAGDLAPLASRTATLVYGVQGSDPLGPLVNTVTVTGTDSLNTPVVVNASTTVNIVAVNIITPTLGLVVEKSVSSTIALAGETITYTYQITNTGEVTLTIAADDDQLGTVAGLAGVLAPLASRTATLAYVVQESDPLGPLVNTVTVTGTYQALSVVVSDTASFTVGIPIYLPRVEN